LEFPIGRGTTANQLNESIDPFSTNNGFGFPSPFP
jgi:hypothetical protein